MISPIAIAVLDDSSQLCQLLLKRLTESDYDCKIFKETDALLQFLRGDVATLPECLLLGTGQDLMPLVEQLQTERILLPAVLFDQALTPEDDQATSQHHHAHYHEAEILLGQHQAPQITHSITRAMVQFLERPALVPLTENESLQAEHEHQQLWQRHQDLIHKLKERLGYLGVYYKRDKDRFLRNLPTEAAEELVQVLKGLYREIVLSYFADTSKLNARIDEFVALAFFADIPVTFIVERHMELMDEFSNQLKLEGRSEDLLLDYRLTLIDTIAHLCEMYRRSIPPEA
ncbi:MAG: circadian clock protein KaiA [Cyanobacteria bacterium P01_H01_bin.121]